MSIIDDVQARLGPEEINQISRQLGVEPSTAQTAVQAALPNLVAGMAGHAQTPNGEQAIEGLLGSHGNILGNLGSILGGGGQSGGSILGSILGSHDEAVGQEVQQASGLDSTKVRQLLMMLAPIILGVLAHRRSQQSAAAPTQSQGGQGTGEVLRQEAQEAQQRSPGVGGLLGKILSHVESPR